MAVSPAFVRQTVEKAARPTSHGGNVTRLDVNSTLGMNCSREDDEVAPPAPTVRHHGGEMVSSVTSRKLRMAFR